MFCHNCGEDNWEKTDDDTIEMEPQQRDIHLQWWKCADCGYHVMMTQQGGAVLEPRSSLENGFYQTFAHVYKNGVADRSCLKKEPRTGELCYVKSEQAMLVYTNNGWTNTM
jgi:hypothetical protein